MVLEHIWPNPAQYTDEGVAARWKQWDTRTKYAFRIGMGTLVTYLLSLLTWDWLSGICAVFYLLGMLGYVYCFTVLMRFSNEYQRRLMLQLKNMQANIEREMFDDREDWQK